MEHIAADTRSELQTILANIRYDWEFLAELVEMLEVDSCELISEIRLAVRDEQPEELMTNAHSLKGILSHVTQGPCFHYADRLEIAGRTGNLDGTSELVNELDTTLTGLISGLQELIASEGKA